MIAREVEDVLGLDRWDAVGVDAVAAIVNDLCCVGALPLTVNAYFATGSSGWYAGRRHASLVTGWRSACDDVGAAWVGGESPTLSGLIDPDQIDLAGSALGRVPEGAAPWLGSSLQPGDEIVVAASSGLHANGASLARALAASPERCPKGWAEELPSGRAFGDAVLDPSVLYPKLVEALFATEIPVHYASHVTGHGWRKLMRAGRDLTYRLGALPEVPEVLAFMVDRAGLDAREAYGTFNMGAGFSLFVAAGAGADAVAAGVGAGYQLRVAGTVEDGPRRVVLEPLGVTYDSSELELR
jgi:phosphoribosylformylglycinamidine cyclo-ligase